MQKTLPKRYNPGCVHYAFICQLVLKAKFWRVTSHSTHLSIKIRFPACIFQKVRNRSCNSIAISKIVFWIFIESYSELLMRTLSLFNSSITIVLRKEARFIIGRSFDVSVRRSYGFLLYIQLCCCLLFIVREYGEFNSYILYSCHPLNALFHRILFTSEPFFRTD